MGQKSLVRLAYCCIPGKSLSHSPKSNLANKAASSVPTTIFQKFFPTAKKPTQPRALLSSDHWPTRIYAIGDVHGCLSELKALEKKIIADSAGLEGDKWIVMLGDYVDRGPDSAGVLNHICGESPVGFRRICLAGNHEIMMLQFLAMPEMTSGWLRFGGKETLQSYGIELGDLVDLPMQQRSKLLNHRIPKAHVDKMTTLPLALSLPGVTFVHAGLRPGIALQQQVEDDLLWIREPFLTGSGSFPFRVVHGHTPVDSPQITGQRIGIDTRAFSSGVLTSLRIAEEFSLSFLNTGPS